MPISEDFKAYWEGYSDALRELLELAESEMEDGETLTELQRLVVDLKEDRIGGGE